MLNQVFDVRWVSSHKLALEQIIRQYTLLVKHLMYVTNDLPEFGQKAVNKANGHLEFFGSRSTPLFMIFNLGNLHDSNFVQYFPIFFILRYPRGIFNPEQKIPIK